MLSFSSYLLRQNGAFGFMECSILTNKYSTIGKSKKLILTGSAGRGILKKPLPLVRVTRSKVPLKGNRKKEVFSASFLLL